MKIDDTNIREFDAKQLSVEFTPPQTTVTVDMFEGALIPSESETYTPLSGITVEVLFRGNDRDEVMTHISDFNALLQKGVVLTLDGYRRKFKGFMTANAPEKTISKGRYKSSFQFTGYWFSDEVTISWQEQNEMIFEAQGNRWTPCRLSITALEYIETMKINGLSDEITIKTIPRGATVVIDGETGCHKPSRAVRGIQGSVHNRTGRHSAFDFKVNRNQRKSQDSEILRIPSNERKEQS